MTRLAFSFIRLPAHRWLLGLALLCLGAAASAQQDPPGRVARLNLQQGTVSFAPAGEDSWYDAQPNRPLTTGDRLWTDRNARAEIHIGSAALRMDGQTHVEFSELDDDTVRITANQGNLQLRVRDDLAGQRVEVDTGNLAVVIDAPGEYRIAADPAGNTTWIAVASGRATLYGENGESQALDARQQLTVSGRNLAAVNGAPAQSGNFDAWVAERNRIEDQSVSARYVSREVVGYQQLDNYGDWQNDPSYGAVWFPRNVDADWAPYRDGQWVNVAPWGLTWVDAAPWGFAPFHYGRWARVGPRWAWVPGRTTARPVYSPALVGFVGGSGANATLQIGDGRSGVGWFPLAPGEQWRPGYRASQRYIDQVNRMAAYRNRQAEHRNDFYANQQMPGAITVVPADRFGRGPFGRRDLVRLPDERFARVPVAPAPGIPMHGFGGGFGRPAAMQPPPQLRARQQQEFQYEQARQAQQMQQAQNIQAMQQRAAQQQAAQQQQQQQMEWQRQQGQRQPQEWQQRGHPNPNPNQWQQQQQQVQLQQQQQQALRQQQELQQRAAQAQAQQQQVQQQQQRAAQQALAQQQMIRQQQETQQRAVQMQQQALAQQQAQQNAMRQAQEAQVRAMQQQRGFAPPPAPQQGQPQPPPGQRNAEERRRLMSSPDSQR